MSPAKKCRSSIIFIIYIQLVNMYII
uniref:Uncharacterized protein n=1 Tax=Anguilla anguilla TaxID=7936 RepID=A0A0E9SCC2_ANGAN